MSEIVTIEKDEIRMNSQMDELGFGKTNYNVIVTQKGVLASCPITEDKNYHFTFSDWTFSDIKSYDIPGKARPYVFYCAKNDFSQNAKTLLTIMNNAEKEGASSEDKNLMFEASFAMCSLLTQAAKEKIKIPVNGAGGIIFDINETEIKILLFPADLFKYSAGALPAQDYANVHGYWVNETIYDLPALCFSRAVIAYKMLTGLFPYPAADITERNADILDRNFLPAELKVKNLDSKLTKEINRALKLNSNYVNIPGKKQKGKASEDLTPTEDFPLELLYASKEIALSNKTNTELEEKAQNYMKSKQSRVNTKRKIRRNATGILIGVIAAFILGLITYNLIATSLDEYCSKGLTSEQTVELFYKCVNDKDSVVLQNISSGRRVNTFINGISQIFVISKQRQTYNHDQGYMTPQGWLFFATDAAKNRFAGVYGISNVTIDGKLLDLTPTAYLKKDKVEPVTIQDGQELTDKQTKTHKVTYYLIRSEGDDNYFEVEAITEIVTLTYKKDRWFITDLETYSKNLELNSPLFKNEYFNAVAEYEGDVIKAVESLSEKYPWLPKKAVLDQEAERIRIASSTLGFL